jgi:hypothetical protein
LFIFKGDTQEACEVHTKGPLFIALIIGLALGVGAAAALFTALPAPGF